MCAARFPGPENAIGVRRRPTAQGAIVIQLTVNGASRQVDVEPEMPLLWALRDVLNLKGTKFGCGISICGACTVHVDGKPARACTTPVGSVAGKSVVTIEGLGRGRMHPVQQAWVQHQVPQCGYCQTGQMMSAAALLAAKPNPTDADINEAMTNICRCGSYVRIRAAIHTAARARA
jgi:isoquinoline 1-oxidoreductase alpha subunit